MGGCRMLNVLLGMSVIAGPLVAANWLVAGGIGLYIVGVTWFARTEATRSKRPPLVMAATVMALGVAMIAWTPRWIPEEWIISKEAWLIVKQQPVQWYLLILAIGMMIGWRVTVAIVKPDPVRVQRAVGYSVLLLIMLDGAACFVLRGPVYAIAIWTLLFPAMFISRRISPT
jgi:4-hydroxybenzoate polyprenyltransferase